MNIWILVLGPSIWSFFNILMLVEKHQTGVRQKITLDRLHFYDKKLNKSSISILAKYNTPQN